MRVWNQCDLCSKHLCTHRGKCGSCGKKLNDSDDSNAKELAQFGFCFCKKCYRHLVDLIKKIEDLYTLREALNRPDWS